MFLACDTKWMPTQRVGGESPHSTGISKKMKKNSSEATHSVLFDTLTLVKEEGAIKISYKLQLLKTAR